MSDEFGDGDDGGVSHRYSKWDDEDLIEEIFIGLYRTEHALKLEDSPEIPLKSGLRMLATAEERDIL